MEYLPAVYRYGHGTDSVGLCMLFGKNIVNTSGRRLVGCLRVAQCTVGIFEIVGKQGIQVQVDRCHGAVVDAGRRCEDYGRRGARSGGGDALGRSRAVRGMRAVRLRSGNLSRRECRSQSAVAYRCRSSDQGYHMFFLVQRDKHDGMVEHKMRKTAASAAASISTTLGR